jgi:hypothetical protein
MAKEDFFGELVAYGKSKGVEVLPLWNSLGHNTLIPTKYPETAPLVGGERSRCGFCVSSPKTYELLFDIYDTIINKYLAPNGIFGYCRKAFHKNNLSSPWYPFDSQALELLLPLECNKGFGLEHISPLCYGK